MSRCVRIGGHAAQQGLQTVVISLLHVRPRLAEKGVGLRRLHSGRLEGPYPVPYVLELCDGLSFPRLIIICNGPTSRSVRVPASGSEPHSHEGPAL